MKPKPAGVTMGRLPAIAGKFSRAVFALDQPRRLGLLAGMSLRQRLLLVLAGALLVSFAAGTWVTTWQAAHLVRAEVSAALETGRRSAAAALQNIAGEPPSRDALIRLVSGFDGSRHVMAELAVAGQTVAQSRPAGVTTVSPAWFARLAAPGLAPVILPVPGGNALALVPLPASETGERWSEARRLLALLAASFLLSATLCLATAAWSLRWLEPLARTFEMLAQGRPASPVIAHGPPELARLATAFNRMQAALAGAARENQRLSSQLDRIAEEERAELARDLHDEIGPLLFAITAWSAAARMQAMAGESVAAGESLHALDEAAAELQKTMRDLLRRLRDSAPASTDLSLSLRELVEFWRSIRPQTRFELDVGADQASPEPARAALFRVAQEAVSNAVRHGNPARVRIGLAQRGTGIALTVQDDGTLQEEGTGGPPGHGLGLIGMEERLQSVGGTLEIDRGRGWTLTAWIPIEDSPVL